MKIWSSAVGLLLISLSALISTTLSGCSASTEPPFLMAPLKQMPEEVLHAPVTVQQAYQVAFANPEMLAQIPCYCGCGAMGHTSNFSCYVSDIGEDGQITYDPHALGCSICVDITQDVMRLLREGKSTSEIRAYVDQVYSHYGTSNIP